MLTIEELKNTPMDCSSYFSWNDYMENKNMYEEQISSIKIDRKSNENIISCSNLIFNCNYYYKYGDNVVNGVDGIDVEKNIYLRESVLKSLMKVDFFLRRNNLCLFLQSGYRSKDFQKALTKNWKGGDVKKRFSHSPHPPHSTGAVFDLQIFCFKTGACLKTKNKKFKGIYPYQSLEVVDLGLDTEWIEIRENIRLIHNVLTKPYVLDEDEVFIPHPYEHWHYGRYERYSKFFSKNKKHKVIYDTIKPSIIF